MANFKTCDKCKKQSGPIVNAYDSSWVELRFQVNGNGFSRPMTKDLCMDCAKALGCEKSSYSFTESAASRLIDILTELIQEQIPSQG